MDSICSGAFPIATDERVGAPTLIPSHYWGLHRSMARADARAVFFCNEKIASDARARVNAVKKTSWRLSV
jgi:hypothetical protein